MNPPADRDPRTPASQQIDRLLRAYEQHQITWQEMQERFDQLVNLYGTRDRAEPRRPQARQPAATALDRLDQLRRRSPEADPPHVE